MGGHRRDGRSGGQPVIAVHETPLVTLLALSLKRQAADSRGGIGRDASIAPSPEGETDADLVRRCLDGERRAFDLLYRRHASATQRRLARLCGADEVEDLLQQVFLEAFRSLPRYRGEASFSTWLYRITVNIAMTALRRRSRRGVEASTDAEMSAIAAVDASPEERAGERELCERALAHLAALKPMHQVAFVLRHVEGLSLAEIGAITGANAPAVGQRVKKAERALAGRLERERRRRRQER